MQRWGLLTGSLTVLLVSTLYAADRFRERTWNVEEYRKKFPYVSLAGRLEYEASGYGEASELTDATRARLEGVEKLVAQEAAWHPRGKSLKILHSDEVNAFVNRLGNGYVRTRIGDPTPFHWDRDEAPVIDLEKTHANEVDAFIKRPGNGKLRAEDPSDLEPEYTPLPVQHQVKDAPVWPSPDMLMQFHNRGTVNFANVAGFGHVKDREHVSGFQSHQFRHMPQVDAGKKDDQAKDRWVIRRLELVSLLMHEKPVVYISEHLPRMGEMDRVPTRVLTPFEESALKTITKGEDLVAEASLTRVRMMGSIRAATQCLECHSVKRGDLLGTFSYELQRVPPQAKK
ncbi:MAG: hypothetical protein K2R98_23405 [Gemmataceae bacterium]|nr:hypothetical protein [Gemmataceae bacterium]